MQSRRLQTCTNNLHHTVALITHSYCFLIKAQHPIDKKQQITCNVRLGVECVCIYLTPHTFYSILNTVTQYITKEENVVNFKKIAVLSSMAVAGLLMASNPAAAEPSASDYSCSDTTTYGLSYASSAYSTCGGTANQASTVTTSTATLKAAASQSAKLVSNRIAAATTGTGQFNLASNSFSASTGMAGGDHGKAYGAWVAGSWSSVEDNNTDTAFDGNVYTVMAGADYKVDDRLLVGLSIGYEDTDIDTAFNGFGGTDGNIDGNGWTIAPYVSYGIADHVRANLVAGYSDVEYDTLRFDTSTGNRITGSTDASRYFVDASLNADYTVAENWTLYSKFGVFYASEEKDAFTETESNGATIAQADNDTDFGQFSLDARVGYLFEFVEPYALVGLEYDFTKDEATVGAGQTAASLDNEDFGARFGGGFNLRLGPNVTGGIEAYTVEFRDDYEEVTATGNLRIEF